MDLNTVLLLAILAITVALLVIELKQTSDAAELEKQLRADSAAIISSAHVIIGNALAKIPNAEPHWPRNTPLATPQWPATGTASDAGLPQQVVTIPKQ